ncbi:hypothetical protein WJM97_13960 [Okeanomitos corallinicola TIOX110]|uniref:Uncharacterized protein n=1 Tax=Okeanomitos corallinicola TIOX110 TaxID=3133117 RepID=A0ABZ2UMY2_9CYAN
MAQTVNLSTYELLVKPIIDSPAPPNRTVIQGYFLTIANPTFSNLEIQLSFTALTPFFNSSTFAAFWDVDGTNNELVPIVDFPCLRTYRFKLPALDTGLFLFLPDVRNGRVVASRSTEIRGYVRLSIPSASRIPSDNSMRTLLISAQQRGTFLPQGNINAPAVGDFDQLSYSLPLANGGSEVTLETDINSNSISSLTLIPRQEIFDAIEKEPSLLSSISSDQFSQQISKLNPDEQRQMLNILLEKFDVKQA